MEKLSEVDRESTLDSDFYDDNLVPEISFSSSLRKKTSPNKNHPEISHRKTKATEFVRKNLSCFVDNKVFDFFFLNSL